MEFGGCKYERKKTKRIHFFVVVCVYYSFHFISLTLTRNATTLQSQNTVLQLAQQVDSIELLELKDELALTLQLCDQYTYNNAFVYFQPGNGKFSIKEPQQLARKAMQQLQEIIALVEEEGS